MDIGWIVQRISGDYYGLNRKKDAAGINSFPCGKRE